MNLTTVPSAVTEDLTKLKQSAPSSVSNISLDRAENSITFTMANKNKDGLSDYQVKVKGLTGVRGGAEVEVSQSGRLLKKAELDFDGRDSFPIALGAVLNSTVGSVAAGKRDQLLNFSNRAHDILDIREPNNLPLTPRSSATPVKLSELNLDGMRGLASRALA